MLNLKCHSCTHCVRDCIGAPLYCSLHLAIGPNDFDLSGNCKYYQSFEFKTNVSNNIIFENGK